MYLHAQEDMPHPPTVVDHATAVAAVTLSKRVTTLRARGALAAKIVEHLKHESLQISGEEAVDEDDDDDDSDEEEDDEQHTSTSSTRRIHLRFDRLLSSDGPKPRRHHDEGTDDSALSPTTSPLAPTLSLWATWLPPWHPTDSEKALASLHELQKVEYEAQRLAKSALHEVALPRTARMLGVAQRDLVPLLPILAHRQRSDRALNRFVKELRGMASADEESRQEQLQLVQREQNNALSQQLQRTDSSARRARITAELADVHNSEHIWQRLREIRSGVEDILELASHAAQQAAKRENDSFFKLLLMVEEKYFPHEDEEETTESYLQMQRDLASDTLGLETPPGSSGAGAQKGLSEVKAGAVKLLRLLKDKDHIAGAPALLVRNLRAAVLAGREIHRLLAACASAQQGPPVAHPADSSLAEMAASGSVGEDATAGSSSRNEEDTNYNEAHINFSETTDRRGLHFFEVVTNLQHVFGLSTKMRDSLERVENGLANPEAMQLSSNVQALEGLAARASVPVKAQREGMRSVIAQLRSYVANTNAEKSALKELEKTAAQLTAPEPYRALREHLLDNDFRHMVADCSHCVFDVANRRSMLLVGKPPHVRQKPKKKMTIEDLQRMAKGELKPQEVEGADASASSGFAEVEDGKKEQEQLISAASAEGGDNDDKEQENKEQDKNEASPGEADKVAKKEKEKKFLAWPTLCHNPTLEQLGQLGLENTVFVSNSWCSMHCAVQSNLRIADKEYAYGPKGELPSPKNLRAAQSGQCVELSSVFSEEKCQRYCELDKEPNRLATRPDPRQPTQAGRCRPRGFLLKEPRIFQQLTGEIFGEDVTVPLRLFDRRMQVYAACNHCYMRNPLLCYPSRWFESHTVQHSIPASSKLPIQQWDEQQYR
ncbi:unnamed protein product [Amoebophrya sp. A25]|nr:unnamed protein product [Amoebophrya sp. A25]|eukprot:GSA25T00012591001.1